MKMHLSENVMLVISQLTWFDLLLFPKVESNRCMKLCFYILKCLANNFEYNNFELFKDSMKNAGQFSADYIVSFLRYGGLG